MELLLDLTNVQSRLPTHSSYNERMCPQNTNTHSSTRVATRSATGSARHGAPNARASADAVEQGQQLRDHTTTVRVAARARWAEGVRLVDDDDSGGTRGGGGSTLERVTQPPLTLAQVRSDKARCRHGKHLCPRLCSCHLRTQFVSARVMARHIVAEVWRGRTRTSVVFPTPGGPCSIQPLCQRIPSCAPSFLYLYGQRMTSRRACNTVSYPAHPWTLGSVLG